MMGDTKKSLSHVTQQYYTASDAYNSSLSQCHRLLSLLKDLHDGGIDRVTSYRYNEDGIYGRE